MRLPSPPTDHCLSILVTLPISFTISIMRRTARTLFSSATMWYVSMLCVSSASLLAADNFDPKTEELQGNRWITIEQPSSQPASDPALSYIEDLIDARRYSEASDRCVKWLIQNKTSPLRDRALFLNAEALYRYGDRVKAFFYLDELMDEYPESRLFYTALDKQYQIADGFLNGYKSRFVGLAILDRQDEAIEMLYRVQQRSPGSPLAEKALLRTADYFYADAQYDLAADAYQAYARAYPRSSQLARVRLRQAFSNYAQFRGLKFDATPIIDARVQLSDMIVQFPEVARQENLQEIIERIDRTFARKLYVTADFYRRTQQPTSAVYTYRFLINSYPDAPEAGQAKTELTHMPAWTLNTPEPGRGPIGVPTTGPTAMAQ